MGSMPPDAANNTNNQPNTTTNANNRANSASMPTNRTNQGVANGGVFNLNNNSSNSNLTPL